MKELDKKISGLRAEFDIEIREKVLEEIDNVKMTPKVYFQSKKSLIGFGFIVLLLVIAFLINLTLYDIQQSNSYEYVGFGFSGFTVFLQSLPYLLVACLVALFTFTIWLMSKFEVSYKKSFAIFIVVLVVGTSMGGTALFASDFNDGVQDKVDNEELKIPVLKPVAQKIYKTFGPRMVDHGLVGKITVPPGETREMVITTPQGKQVNVMINHNCKILPKENGLTSGDLIIMMGEPVVNFHAKGIKVIEDQKRAVEMMKKLKGKHMIMKFRSSEPLNDFKDFPHDAEKRQEFLENMGGVLQSGRDIKQMNIIFE